MMVSFLMVLKILLRPLGTAQVRRARRRYPLGIHFGVGSDKTQIQNNTVDGFRDAIKLDIPRFESSRG